MSYRIQQPKPHKPHRTAQKTTTPSRYYMTNGTTFDLAIPCWYQEIHKPVRAKVHCKDWHDYIGRPSPNHPDHSCQLHDFAAYDHHDHHEHCREEHSHTWHHDPHHLHHRGHVRHLVDMAQLIPIHLSKEGYENVIIATNETYEGLVIKGWIDEVDDWVIRVKFNARLEEATEKPVEIRFIVKVTNETEEAVDTVSLGHLVIMPAPLEG